MFTLNSKMKISKLLDPKVLGVGDPSNMEFLTKKIYFVKRQPNAKKDSSAIVTLDEKNVLRNHFLPVSNKSNCLPIAPLGESYLVGCDESKSKNNWPFTRIFAASTDGFVKETKLPVEGLWEQQYSGSDGILFKVTESYRPRVHRFFKMDKSGIVSFQFDITNIYGDFVNILAARENGWIIRSATISDSYPTYSDCGVADEVNQTFFVDKGGVLKTFGQLGANESIYFDDYWSSKGRFYFERQIINSERCPVRKEKYEVDKFGEAKKLSSQPGEGTRPKVISQSEEADPGLYRSLGISPDEFLRELAAYEICPLLSKGKAQGKTMFNGHAICREDKKLVAYPYPEWKMPQSAENIFPNIEQSNPGVKPQLMKKQAAGVGDPTWANKCPEFIDVPYRIGAPGNPEVYAVPQPKILGFKFDGTGQIFTRLADGTSKPSTQPDYLVGCYVNLPSPDRGMGENGWGIGTISRDSSGYYWTNAAGVRWGLSLSGSILTTDKENPYYDKGRQFITFG